MSELPTFKPPFDPTKFEPRFATDTYIAHLNSGAVVLVFQYQLGDSTIVHHSPVVLPIGAAIGLAKTIQELTTPKT